MHPIELITPNEPIYPDGFQVNSVETPVNNSNFENYNIIRPEDIFDPSDPEQ